MPELLKQWAPQAYGIWTLVLLAIVYLAREWRETRKLSSADRLARREGYAAQVASLQDENRNLRQDIALLRREYDGYRHLCQEENDQLRGTVRELEDKVAGLKRRIDQQGSSTRRIIEDARDKPPDGK
jgi:predicted  nucleic acid-binding Zn-ribbon protein